jgi:fructose-1-phosphate kinase PfkB-like protein
MRKKEMRNILVWLIFIMVAFSPLSGITSETVTITGEVRDNFQLVDGNGQFYEIADTTQGNELAEKHIGEKVKVIGTLEKSEDYQVIVVTSFETLAQ